MVTPTVRNNFVLNHFPKEGNEQALPMSGSFIFVCPELLPVFLKKLNN
jgi:hypothetical protein